MTARRCMDCLCALVVVCYGSALFGAVTFSLVGLAHTVSQSFEFSPEHSRPATEAEFTQDWQATLAQVEEEYAPFNVLGHFKEGIDSGDVETAYGHTSEDFQERLSLGEFADVRRLYPAVFHRCVDFADGLRTTDFCLFRVTTEADDGSRYIVDFRLRKEHGKWKVDEILSE